MRMKKYIIFLLLLPILSATSYAQTDMSSDSLKLLQNKRIEQGDLGKMTKQDTKQEQKTGQNNVSDDVSDKKRSDSDSIINSLKIHLPPVYVGPGDNPSKIPTTFLLENEYAYYRYAPLSSDAAYFTSSTLNVYPGLGAVNQIAGSIIYSPFDWMDVSTVAYISKYTVFGSTNNDMGVMGNFKFYLNNRFRINAFGQYSVYGKKNGVGGNFSGMYPESYYGGTLEMKINESFGVQGGMLREFDPASRKWKNRMILSPVFYRNK